MTNEESIEKMKNIIIEYSTQVDDYKCHTVPVRLDEDDIEAIETILNLVKNNNQKYMTDKEKEAIERLKRGSTDSYIIIKKDVTTLLNLIETQQAEIEDWKTKYNNLKSYNKGTKEALRVSEEMEKYYSIEASELEIELEEKDNLYHRVLNDLVIADKIIDEMANEIREYWDSKVNYEATGTIEQVIEYFRRKI